MRRWNVRLYIVDGLGILGVADKQVADSRYAHTCVSSAHLFNAYFSQFLIWLIFSSPTQRAGIVRTMFTTYANILSIFPHWLRKSSTNSTKKLVFVLYLSSLNDWRLEKKLFHFRLYVKVVFEYEHNASLLFMVGIQTVSFSFEAV